MIRRGEQRWRRLRDDRARRRAEQLERLFKATPPIDDDLADGPYVEERSVAKALATAPLAKATPSSDPMLAIRAALAARQAGQEESMRRRARTSLRVASAAALVAVVLIAVASLSPDRPGSGVDEAELEASKVLRILNYTIEQVRDRVEDGDREGARERSFAARDAINDTAEAARRLPQGNPVRDKLLEEAYAQVATLQQLVTRVQLEVPPLSAPATSTLTSTTTTPSSPDAIAAPPSTSPGSPSSTQPTVVQSAPATTTTTAAPSTTTTRPAEPSPTTTTSTAPPSVTTTTRPPTPTTLPPPTPSTTAPPVTTTTTAAPATTTTTTIPPSTTTTKPAVPPVTTTTRLGGG